ncbi:hypothetical protein MTO96_000168 [Rhipicephalus appendiculatus]
MYFYNPTNAAPLRETRGPWYTYSKPGFRTRVPRWARVRVCVSMISRSALRGWVGKTLAKAPSARVGGRFRTRGRLSQLGVAATGHARRFGRAKPLWPEQRDNRVLGVIAVPRRRHVYG